MIPSLGIVIVTTESDWGPAVQTYPDIKSTNDAIKILNNRYAKGEITKEEYEQIKKDIESQQRRGKNGKN